MTLPGGPANKLGNRYEKWWAVSQLVRMLRGDADEIRIEDPTTEKAEFVVKVRSYRELHQVKRDNQSGKWSIAALCYDGLLHAIGEQLAGNDDRFVFASGSDARELSELCEAARNEESVEEFKRAFLVANKRKKPFERLLGCWKCDATAAVDQLRRIEIHTIDECELVDKVRCSVQALFLANPNSVVEKLRGIAEDSVHRKLSRRTLVHELAQHGYQLRRLRSPMQAGDAVEAATNRYVDGARFRLIQKKLVPRKAAEMLLSRLEGKATDSVLTGKAGAGKTACIIEVVEGLHARGMPVLAFRLDRVLSANSTTDLGSLLDLEESPVLVLAAAAEAAGSPGVLIVDQLDAVSTMSGRKSEAVDLVERLLWEARGTRSRAIIHTVVVCRAFDWKNDSRLRKLMPDSHPQVDVSDFTANEVKRILAHAGFDPGLFQKRQLELLGLPQNLSLFIDCGIDPSCPPGFSTATKLFDQYWDRKRQSVEDQVTRDQWMDVMETLSNEMNATQQLSVAKEKLDLIQPDYLRCLESEGVLSFDGRRYGFGHESFFDYCFARLFFNRSDSLASFLTKSEQHLFRRAQVRQALSYLREADFDRYIQEVGCLLSDERIRPHIKHLVFALLADVAEPTDVEWAIWDRHTAPAIKAIEQGTLNPNKLSELALRRFFGANSWFTFAGTQKLITQWLASGSNRLADEAVDYLKIHQRRSPDIVADLLEPYADSGDDWPQRLRYIMNFVDLGTSRRFFDFYLRLVDNGVLHDSSKPLEINGTFRRILHSLAESRPEWVPDVLARILQRRFSYITETGQDWRNVEFFGHDDSVSEILDKAAAKSPDAYVEHLLPTVLQISDSALIGDKRPRYDAVWPILVDTDRQDGEEACLSALAKALGTLANEGTFDLSIILADLRGRDTHIANHLLLALYLGGGPRYADEAVSLLCEECWRFECGIYDNPNWCAMEAIQAVVPHCSPENRNRLETVVMRYVNSYERTGSGFKENGRARFALLSAIPSELRSPRAILHFDELKRKFSEPEGKPRKITGGFVPSPIESAAAKKMTDDQWLRAIAKYSQNRIDYSGEQIIGGAPELARILQTRATEESVRFAQLSLRFPAGTNSVYMNAVLRSLANASISTELKFSVCHKAFKSRHVQINKTIADVLGNMDETLPDQAVHMLHHLATEEEDPDKELWRGDAANGQPYYDGDIYLNGINTTRGSAADAIRDLIIEDATYVDRFTPTLERMTRDPSPSVLSCVAGAVEAVAFNDISLGMSLFRQMNLSEDRLLATRNVYRLIQHGIHEDLAEMLPIIGRMLRSSEPDVQKAGARLASIAALVHEESTDAADLVSEALSGNASCRLGVAQVASANLSACRYRSWTTERLAALFNDEDIEVRRISASCFDKLGNESLETYDELIKSFCDSRAFQDAPTYLIETLEESTARLPGITCEVCKRFLERLSDEARDIRTSRFADAHAVGKLVFRTYQQHENDIWAGRALDLIDRLCLEGVGDIGNEFEEFER